MNILVVDGQGGGIGKAIIEKLKNSHTIFVTALATNQYAAAKMKKAGAAQVFYEEKDMTRCIHQAELIVGAIGIIAPGAMMGEITPRLAQEIATSPAKKILIPLNKCNFFIIGAEKNNLAHYLEDAVKLVVQIAEQQKL